MDNALFKGLITAVQNQYDYRLEIYCSTMNDMDLPYKQAQSDYRLSLSPKQINQTEFCKKRKIKDGSKKLLDDKGKEVLDKDGK
jgi:hypothetical protein